MTADVTDTFIHPCLTCGTTVHVVDGQEQPHTCQTFSEPDSPAAYAWWQGHDAAVRKAAGEALDALLAKVRAASKGEVETWGLVAMVHEMAAEVRTEIEAS